MSRGWIFVPGLALVLFTGCSLGPLHDAARDGDMKTVEALLDQGADVRELSHDMTALFLAAAEGHLDTVNVLLDRGADVNGSGGVPPLLAAAGRGRLAIVKLLLARGAIVKEDHIKWAKRNYEPIIAKLLEDAFARQAGLSPVPSSGPQVASVPPASVSPPALTSDVDRVPTLHGVTKKNAYAVVIGIEQYRQQLPKADFAAHDAKIVSDYLTKVMGYPEENVVTRLNDKAAKTDLEKYLEEWLPSKVRSDDSVFVYYSGHGAPNPKSGEPYLVPYDGDPAFVESTTYPLKRLYAALDKLPAKDIVVMLDSCFSGAGGRSVIAKGMRPMGLSIENPVLASGKTIVLAASSGTQVSSTFLEQGHGLLTYFFLKGLQGEGDINKDGTIAIPELYEYVRPNVERVARNQYNNEQTPQLLASPDMLRRGGGRLIERTQ